MAAAGHELAVHGWKHECMALEGARTPPAAARSRHASRTSPAGRSRWYRPPYGVMTGHGLHAAHRAGLRTVLWSAWGARLDPGRDPGLRHPHGLAALEPGGTVLLHDTDRTSAPGSWRTTLGRVRAAAGRWAARGLEVGPLREHW